MPKTTKNGVASASDMALIRLAVAPSIFKVWVMKNSA
jgi:hypothetical protein